MTLLQVVVMGAALYALTRRSGQIGSREDAGTPTVERPISPEDARLADAGSRYLFNKLLSSLIGDFERVGKEVPVELIDVLIAWGKREPAA